MFNKIIASLASIVTIGRALRRGNGVNWTCELQKDDIKNDIPRIEGFGLTSIPPNNSNAIILFRGGNKRDGVIITIASDDGKPDIEQGEVAIHNSSGVYLRIKNDGTVLIEGGKLLVNGHDISDNQGIAKTMQEMRDLFNDHGHTETGTVTGKPNTQM